MSNQPYIIEREFDVPVARVWDAITRKEQMKKWYFNLEEFRAVPGFEFSFKAGPEGMEYKHICRITEVVPNKKLSYTWHYDGYPGNSLLSFELFDEGKKTKLKLTHAGLESFASAGPDFTEEKFAEGWTFIVGDSLKKFLEA
jgi:uncharacterized protein YndB with AHSA1/START domain